MKFQLVVVGRDRRDPICEAAADYLSRIRHYHQVSLLEVREEPIRSGTPADRVRAQEAQRIKKALKPQDRVVLLDGGGRALSSVEMSERMSNWTDSGIGSVSFVIGGPIGLDPSLFKDAHERWSLSRLTLPHRVARLGLAEQLYRACTILRGEPYHK